MYKLYRQKIKGGIAVDEIKVGEYVRTKNGLIGKVNKIELKGSETRFAGEYLTDTIIQFNDGKVYERRVKDNYIVKHSKNIIDLIELGDIIEVVTEEDFEEEYTDKLEVAAVGITDCKGNKLNEIGICGDHGIEYVALKDIRIILTHEQYERNCYRLEDN